MSRAEAAHSAGLFAPAPRHARGSAFAPRYTATVKGGDSILHLDSTSQTCDLVAGTFNLLNREKQFSRRG